MICPACTELQHEGECKAVLCPDCKGTGKVDEEYEVGGYTPDRWVEIRTRLVECELCDGWGEIPAEKLGDDDAL